MTAGNIHIKQLVDEKYGGNLSAFAREFPVSRQVAWNWVNTYRRPREWEHQVKICELSQGAITMEMLNERVRSGTNGASNG